MQNNEKIALPRFEDQQERAAVEFASGSNAADQIEVAVAVKCRDADMKISVHRIELRIAQRKARKARQEADFRDLVCAAVNENEGDHKPDFALGNSIKAKSVFSPEVVKRAIAIAKDRDDFGSGPGRPSQSSALRRPEQLHFTAPPPTAPQASQARAATQIEDVRQSRKRHIAPQQKRVIG